MFRFHIPNLNPQTSNVETPAPNVGIKWPNDIVAIGRSLRSHRKLAGILVEQIDDLALIGVGMNITQQSWPIELADRAISLAQLGASSISRLDAIEALLTAMSRALIAADNVLVREFTGRDALHGCETAFQTPAGLVRGRVLRIDPLRGLLIVNDDGRMFLPAATTSIVPE